MRTFVELLQGPAGRDPAARAEFLESSAVQLDRLDWLAQNLLELSKLDSGLVLLDLRPDDVRGTIESAVEQQQPAAERKGIRMTTDLPDRPLRIRHDPPRVGQIVSQPRRQRHQVHGGATARSRCSATATPDGGATIEVSDTGVGIAAAELPQIFDRFYRGSDANEARGTGSGLGLAIVKSIVDMHHGTIEVESRLGYGSKFVVRLPRDPREVGLARGGPAIGTADPRRRRRGVRCRDREGRRFFTKCRPHDESRSGTLVRDPRATPTASPAASQREDPRSHERRSRGGRSPGRRRPRSARRDADRSRWLDSPRPRIPDPMPAGRGRRPASRPARAPGRTPPARRRPQAAPIRPPRTWRVRATARRHGLERTDRRVGRPRPHRPCRHPPSPAWAPPAPAGPTSPSATIRPVVAAPPGSARS